MQLANINCLVKRDNDLLMNDCFFSCFHGPKLCYFCTAEPVPQQPYYIKPPRYITTNSFWPKLIQPFSNLKATVLYCHRADDRRVSGMAQ